jgi:hypothetical protein
MMLGRLLTGTVLDVRADPDWFSALFDGARRAAIEIEASDPLPTTVRELHAAFSQGMAAAAARQVLRLCTILSADDRQLVVRALLLTEES